MKANAYTVTRTVVETTTILVAPSDDGTMEVEMAEVTANETPIQYWVRDIKDTEIERDPSQDYRR